MLVNDKKGSKTKTNYLAITILIISVLIGGIGLGGIWLTTFPENFEEKSTAEFPLEKFHTEYDEKTGEATYNYTVRIGAYRLSEQVKVKKNKESEEKIRLYQAKPGESDKLVITNYVLKNKFYASWMHRNAEYRQYEFFVN